MALSADSLRFAQGWIPKLDSEQTLITLHDAASSSLEMASSSGVAGRHSDRANVLFIDGHVVPVDLSADALSRIALLR